MDRLAHSNSVIDTSRPDVVNDVSGKSRTMADRTLLNSSYLVGSARSCLVAVDSTGMAMARRSSINTMMTRSWPGVVRCCLRDVRFPIE